MPFSWAATPTAVAAILRARTKSAYGQEEGQWGTNTRPTLAQVTELCTMATARVAARLGAREDRDLCNAALKESAKAMAVVRAAMYVEMSYSPDDIDNDRSPYDRLKEDWDEGMAELAEAVAEQCGWTSGGEAVGGAGTLPSGAFPASSNVGRQDW